MVKLSKELFSLKQYKELSLENQKPNAPTRNSELVALILKYILPVSGLCTFMYNTNIYNKI